MSLLAAMAAVIASYAAAQTSTAVSASARSDATHIKTHLVTRSIRVAAPGTYAVIVSLSPTKTSEKADVYAGSENEVGIGLNSSQGDKIEFMVAVKKRTMHVLVVSHGPKVSFSVASALQTPQLTTPPVVTSTGSTSPTAPVTGPYNSLVWSDEFNGPAGSLPNPANWGFDSGGGCGPGTLSTNTPTPNAADAELDGQGHLAIISSGPFPYSAAQLDTDGMFSFTYGRIEARIDVAPGQGICSAFWLLADDGEQVGWPNGGEIDVMEAIGDLPSQTNGFLHGPVGPVNPNSNYQQWNAAVNSVTPLAGSYHTYGMIWKPNSLTWTLDGVPFATATPTTLYPTSTWVFNGHPFHILLDEAIGGWPGNPNSATVFPAVMGVDWVRVYQ